MGAMGSGALVLALCAKMRPEQFKSARLPWIAGLQEKGIVSGVGLGAALLGVGMATAGACPGMVLAQVGAGVENSGITLVGGFLGALVYGVAEGPLTRRLACGSCHIEAAGGYGCRAQLCRTLRGFPTSWDSSS